VRPACSCSLLLRCVVWIVPHITSDVNVACTVRIKYQPALDIPIFVLLAIVRDEEGWEGEGHVGS